MRHIQRGDIFYADLSPVIDSEQGGIRPVLIIQNNVGNKYSPNIIIIPITSQISKSKLPTHVEVEILLQNGVIMSEHIRSISKSRLREKIGHITDDKMELVDEALRVSIGLK